MSDMIDQKLLGFEMLICLVSLSRFLFKLNRIDAAWQPCSNQQDWCMQFVQSGPRNSPNKRLTTIYYTYLSVPLFQFRSVELSAPVMVFSSSGVS